MAPVSSAYRLASIAISDVYAYMLSVPWPIISLGVIMNRKFAELFVLNVGISRLQWTPLNQITTGIYGKHNYLQLE